MPRPSKGLVFRASPFVFAGLSGNTAGKSADFVVFDADPFDKIANTRKITAWIANRGGRL